MTATNHALAGALIGTILPLPLAIPAAFTSHFAMDVLPHYAVPQTKRNKSGTYKLIVAGDVFIFLAIMASALLIHKWVIFICSLIALSPDFLWAIYYFRHNRSLYFKPKNTFLRFHQKIQHFERPWGIAVELTLAAIALPLFIRLIRHY